MRHARTNLSFPVESIASKFTFPDWAFDDLPPPTPVPQPTPEEAEANDARVRDLNNQFIDYKQQVLFTAPQAFLRQQGSDAITRAGEADEILDTLRQQTLDQTANAHQRTRLAEMLDWHLVDAKEQVRRHVVKQSDVRQQSVAARTVELATKQAALESADAEKVGFVALAAYDAEKARALKAGLGSEIAHESGRMAWSGAYKAAIETQAGTDPQQAVRLFDQAKATLDPQTREALQPRIDDLSRGAQAEVLADKALAPGADRAALLDDPAVTPEVKQLAENKIAMRETAASAARQSQIDTLDSRLGRDTPQALANATYVPGTYAVIASGYASAGDPDKTASARQIAANETLLTGFAAMTPAYQAATLAKLEPGPVRDQALRIKDTTARMLASDPLLWGTTSQRANGVGELVPLDPQTLDQREQQARHVEALSGQPTLAMTKKEIAELKTTLDTAPLAGKQTMLRNLANGLTVGAIARLASALARQGPLAGGYAFALSTYAARDLEQNVLADRIMDGLDRMKAAGEGGKPVADTGPGWRQAFDEKTAATLASLDEKNAAGLRTATAALYTQSMALKGRDSTIVDGDELDSAIRDSTRGADIVSIGFDQDHAANDETVMSDASPDSVEDGQQYAQASRPPWRRLGGRPLTPIEEMRVSNFRSHLDAIRELEPNNTQLSYIAPRDWVPNERDVARIHEELLRARQRKAGLNDGQIGEAARESTLGVGKYAGESIPARSEKRNFNEAERERNNHNGDETGCHTCGTSNPGSVLGNFALDHQPPTALNPSGGPQRLYPQCISCSQRQGGEVLRQLRLEQKK